MQPLLWDTFTAIWIYEKARLSPAALEAMRAAYREGVPSYISPITAWEVALLASRGRLQLLIRPEPLVFEFVRSARRTSRGNVARRVLIASSYLPGKPPKDPTDRIMAATARELGATLITRDRALLDYGAQGHVAVLEC